MLSILGMCVVPHMQQSSFIISSVSTIPVPINTRQVPLKSTRALKLQTNVTKLTEQETFLYNLYI